jgi:hypothetical protein
MRGLIALVLTAALAYVGVSALVSVFERPAPCRTDTECARRGGGGGPESAR